MRVLACLLLVACGGSDGAPEGEPLVASTLMGQHGNNPWTPMFGFGRQNGTTFELFFGQEDIACSDSFDGKPREGNYAATGVAFPPTVGSYPTQPYNLLQVDGNDVDTHLGTGSVMITNVGPTEVSAVLGYSENVGGSQFSLTGAVTLKRCM